MIGFAFFVGCNQIMAVGRTIPTEPAQEMAGKQEPYAGAVSGSVRGRTQPWPIYVGLRTEIRAAIPLQAVWLTWYCADDNRHKENRSWKQ